MFWYMSISEWNIEPLTLTTGKTKDDDFLLVTLKDHRSLFQTRLRSLTAIKNAIIALSWAF